MRGSREALATGGVSPAEGFLRGGRGPRDGITTQTPRKAAVRDLGVDTSIGVWALHVQVTARGNGVVRGVASIGVGLMGPPVAPHLRAHVGQGLHLRCGGGEDARAGVLVRAEEAAVDLLGLRGAHAVAHVLVPRPVLRGPEARGLQPPAHVLCVREPGDLLKDDERSVLDRAPRLETAVVHDHPLAAVRARGAPAHELGPLVGCLGKPVREHDPHEVRHTLTIVFQPVIRLVCEHGNGGLCNDEARVQQVVIIRAAGHAGVGGEAHPLHNAAAQGQVVVLEDPGHLAVIRERCVAHHEVLVACCQAHQCGATP
mmetsp:Transcript_110144/g.306910  ORF Transcript_110144/g.306910 Transcript_110144/m.306910 type:complete len:314 (-) Transcript_110144:188-1129(-)